MIPMVEIFMVRYLKLTADLNTFDDLRLAGTAFKMDLRKPFAPQPMQENIKRAYYQNQLWIEAPITDAILEMITQLYGLWEKKYNSS